MGWLSTYTQTVYVDKNGIDGKSLKDKLIEDNILVKENDKYILNIEGIRGRSWDEFYSKSSGSTCFCDEGNGIAITFESNCDDFLKGQLEGLKSLSQKYPEVTFGIHSSYCPGGCGLRKTALDAYFKNGKDLSISYLLNIKFCAGSDDAEDVDTGLYILTTPVSVSLKEIKEAFEQANNLCSPYKDEEEDGLGFPVSYDIDGLNLDTLLKAVTLYRGGWNFRRLEDGDPVSATAYYEIEQWQ